jgi:hypothetical protein
MLKGKILLMIALYIILGVIAFFNFGLYHYTPHRVEWKSTIYDDAREDFDENIQAPQTEAAEESQAPPPDIEMNN